MADPQETGIAMLGRLEAGETSAATLAADLAGQLAQARSLNALCDLDLDLAGQARGSDARRAGGSAGALEGLPICVKDNIALNGFPTTGGTPTLASYQLAEGLAIARLRAAGAVFAAKSHLHELAFGITGTNAHSGAVGNPFDPARLAGGSSSGAAAAVAVGACAVAIGTDTGGSCRVPGAHCGVVGFRPSTYRYPVDGYLRLSPSRDTLGLLARCVADIALVDAVIAPEPAPPTAALDSPVRLGVVRLEPIDAEVAECFEQALALLSGAGVDLVEVDLGDVIASDAACGFAIALYETALSIAGLARAACDMNLADFAATIASEDVRELIASQCGAEAVSAEIYAQAIGLHLPRLRSGFARALEGVDALIYPTAPMTAPAADVGPMVAVGGVQMPVFAAYSLATRPDSMAGVPSVSLPCGMAAGMPTGLQLVGRAGQDRRLLALAQQIEALLLPRHKPLNIKESSGYG